jgi:6-phosphogluconolactonase (cycloisomerase 2 family)
MAQTRLFAYVANQQSDSITVFSVDNNTGALSMVSVAATGPMPNAVVVDPMGRFAYAGNSAENGGTPSVSAYTIDSNTGTLTPVLGSPYPTGQPPSSCGMTVDPRGKFLYIAQCMPASYGYSVVTAYNINQSTGALTPVPGSPYQLAIGASSVTTDPLGKFLFVAHTISCDVPTYSIDANTGALTPVAGSPFASGCLGYFDVVDPTGRFLYITDFDPDTISGHRIDPNSGVLTPLAGSPFPNAGGTGVIGIAIDPTGQFLYTTNQSSNNVSGYSIDPNTGVLTPLPSSPFAAGTHPQYVSIDPSGKFAYTANPYSNNVSAYSIDPNTGALTAIPGSPFATGSAPIWVTIASEAVSPTLTLQQATGGNVGSVTTTIFGNGFTPPQQNLWVDSGSGSRPIV